MQVKLRRVSEKPGWSREPKKLKNSPTNKRDGVFMPNSVAELKSNRKCTRFRRIHHLRAPYCWEENVIIRCEEGNEGTLRVMKAGG